MEKRILKQGWILKIALVLVIGLGASPFRADERHDAGNYMIALGRQLILLGHAMTDISKLDQEYKPGSAALYQHVQADCSVLLAACGQVRRLHPPKMFAASHARFLVAMQDFTTAATMLPPLTKHDDPKKDAQVSGLLYKGLAIMNSAEAQMMQTARARGYIPAGH